MGCCRATSSHDSNHLETGSIKHYLYQYLLIAHLLKITRWSNISSFLTQEADYDYLFYLFSSGELAHLPV
jgi:hypothetical protein